MRGTWREGSFRGTQKDIISKTLEMDVCFHRGPVSGEHGGMLLSWGL